MTAAIGCLRCNHLSCVCVIQRRHTDACRFRISATCPIGIPCEHGRDTCPICDACNCGAEVNEEDLDSKILIDRWNKEMADGRRP